MVIEHRYKLYEKITMNIRNFVSHSTNNVTHVGVAAHILSIPVQYNTSHIKKTRRGKLCCKHVKSGSFSSFIASHQEKVSWC